MADFYAAPNGSGTACSQAAPCTIGQWLSNPAQCAPGNRLLLNDGVYQGTNQMITPPTGRAGTSDSSRIIIAAINDGGALIDGQFDRVPVNLPSATHRYWLIEGINVRHGTSACVATRGGFNIFRRIVAWDLQFNYTPGNTGTLFTCLREANTGDLEPNLFEDCAGFGITNQITSASQNYRSVCTFRRIWGRLEGSCDANNAHAASYNMYNSTGHTCENCLTEFRQMLPLMFTVRNPTSTSSGSCPGNICDDGSSVWSVAPGHSINRYDATHGKGATGDLNAQVLGSIGYVREGANLSRKLLDALGSTACSPPAANSRCAWQVSAPNRRGGNITFRDYLLIVEPTHADFDRTRALNMAKMDSVGLPLIIDRVSTIAGNVDRINVDGTTSGQWTVTNHVHAVDVNGLNSQNANPWLGTTGANLCHRYIDRVRTTQKLWPWPMNERIKAAYAIAGPRYGVGYQPVDYGCDSVNADCQGAFPDRDETIDVTATMEALLGPIPAECMEGGVPPPPTFPPDPNFGTEPLIDGFSGTGPMSVSWNVEDGSGWSRVNGVAVPNSDFSNIRHTNPINSQNQGIWVGIPGPPDSVGLFISMFWIDRQNRLRISVHNDGTIRADLFVDGVRTSLLAPTNLGVTPGANDFMAGRVVGGVLSVGYRAASWGEWRRITEVTIPGGVTLPSTSYFAMGAASVGFQNIGGGIITIGDTTPPSTPGPLTVTPVNPNQIDLSLAFGSNDDVEVTEYIWHRSVGDCNSFFELKRTSGIATIDTSVAPGTFYCYKVQATDAAGNLSGFTAEVSATTPEPPDVTPPTAPAMGAITLDFSNVLIVEWFESVDTESGIAEYLPERCFGQGCLNFEPLPATPVNVFIDTNLASGLWRYRVRARDNANNISAYSEIGEGVVPGIPVIPHPIVRRVYPIFGGSK